MLVRDGLLSGNKKSHIFELCVPWVEDMVQGEKSGKTYKGWGFTMTVSQGVYIFWFLLCVKF